MAVQNTITLTQLTGNGSTTIPYPTGFAFGAAEWLVVLMTNQFGASVVLNLGTHYTVTGAGNVLGGDVRTVVSYPSTHRLTISRVTPITQLLDLEYNDRLPAQLVEDALDKAALISQEIAAVKKLTFPQAEPVENDLELPEAFLRKGCVLGFDPLTGEAVLFESPLPVLPVQAPSLGTYILASINGNIKWMPTLECSSPT